MIASYYKIRI